MLMKYTSVTLGKTLRFKQNAFIIISEKTINSLYYCFKCKTYFLYLILERKNLDTITFINKIFV